MHTRWVLIAGIALLGHLAGTSPAVAQSQTPASTIHAATGWAGFIDESWIDHAVVGAGGRVYVSPKIAIGPEVLYLRGPEGDHDWTVTGEATIDLVSPRPRVRLVTPYLAFGGGYVIQTARTGRGPYTSSQGTASAGVGARIVWGSRFFVASEMRLGIEPELQVKVLAGLRLGR